MVKPYDQRRVRDDEPIFVQQLDVIEVKDEDDVLVAIKRKFQADANRQRWIRDDVVDEEDLEDYEEKLIDINRYASRREDVEPNTEDEKKKFGRETLRRCEEKAVTLAVSSVVPYSGYGEGMLHALADNLKIGWHPEWKTLFRAGSNEVNNVE